MNKTLHTPAPWKWWCSKSGRPRKYDLARLDAKSKSIFTVYGGAGLSALGDSPEDRANARLIAAAPELLALVQRVAEIAIYTETGHSVFEDARVLLTKLKAPNRGARSRSRMAGKLSRQ